MPKAKFTPMANDLTSEQAVAYICQLERDIKKLERHLRVPTRKKVRFDVYKATARYGRGEMVCRVLVAANSARMAKKLANGACPVPVMSVRNDIVAHLIPDLSYTSDQPVIITKF